jgi:hypothetical protein
MICNMICNIKFIKYIILHSMLSNMLCKIQGYKHDIDDVEANSYTFPTGLLNLKAKLKCKICPYKLHHIFQIGLCLLCVWRYAVPVGC